MDRKLSVHPHEGALRSRGLFAEGERMFGVTPLVRTTDLWEFAMRHTTSLDDLDRIDVDGEQTSDHGATHGAEVDLDESREGTALHETDFGSTFGTHFTMRDSEPKSPVKKSAKKQTSRSAAPWSQPSPKEITSKWSLSNQKHKLVPWRLSHKIRTPQAILVMCLNVGVDPPDAVRIKPTAHLECWTDPQNEQRNGTIHRVGELLRAQYGLWQPRGRFHVLVDKPVDDVQKSCLNVRTSVKNERIYMHFNGHGVPRPTKNGEIWMFNRDFSQYVPISFIDIRQWVGSPAMFAFDCSSAGNIISGFLRYLDTHEFDVRPSEGERPMSKEDILKQTYILCPCAGDERLPMDPRLPADIFTSCLTTPVKMGLLWHCIVTKIVDPLPEDILSLIPGAASDRKTPLGELNWIFTAITDTIAWNILPRDQFQELFRKDVLVASMFRNFLLADRILRMCSCSPCSLPQLPSSHGHPLWDAWDFTVDNMLHFALSGVSWTQYKSNSFFWDHLQAFDVWLSYGTLKRSPPQQLPVVLQVLLCQTHRQRAMELLARFLDLGPWAVNQALAVGIFPYIVKLLRTNVEDLREALVFVWTNVLLLDEGCRNDLLHDKGIMYFITSLGLDTVSIETHAMACFCLSVVCDNFPDGQAVCLDLELVTSCMRRLETTNSRLQKWLCLCLARLVDGFRDAAEWVAHQSMLFNRLEILARDGNPEVRAAVLYFLGIVVFELTERNALRTLELRISTLLFEALQDGSPVVRREAVHAIGNIIQKHAEEMRLVAGHAPISHKSGRRGPLGNRVDRIHSADLDRRALRIRNVTPKDAFPAPSPSPSTGATLPALQQLPARQITSHDYSSSGSFSSTESSDPDMDDSDDEDSDAGHLDDEDDEDEDDIDVDDYEYEFDDGHEDGMEDEDEGNDEDGGDGGDFGSSKRRMRMRGGRGARSTSSRASSSSSSKRRSLVPPPQTPSTAFGVPIFTDEIKDQPSLFRAMWVAVQFMNIDPAPQVARVSERVMKFLIEGIHGEEGSLSPSLEGMPGDYDDRDDGLRIPSSRGERSSSSEFDSGPRSLPRDDIGHLDPRMSRDKRRRFGQGRGAGFGRGNPNGMSTAPTTPATPPSRVAGARGRSAGAHPGAGGRGQRQKNRFISDFFERSKIDFALPRFQSVDEEIASTEMQMRLRRDALVLDTARTYVSRTFHHFDDKFRVLACSAENSTTMVFHPFEPLLLITDGRDHVSVHNWQGNHEAHTIYNRNFGESRITGLELINPSSESFLAVGSNDGCIRVWKDYFDATKPPKLVTSFVALKKHVPRKDGRDFLISWQQHESIMYVGGEFSVVSVWDMGMEQCVNLIPTGSSHAVTSMTCDQGGGQMCVVGCGDGTIRVLDQRLKGMHSVVSVFKADDEPIVGVHLQRADQTQIITGSFSGHVRLWDSRVSSAYSVLPPRKGRMTEITVHDYAPLIARGTAEQFVDIIDTSGKELGVLYGGDGFLEHYSGTLQAMQFHPTQLCLGIASSDGTVSMIRERK
eukprot:TRINITY_DN1192_c0_g1_i3.p1 TRINITY_DN1192_c0_g1~~TRINITY_DN1192_c0_g1_i3.p1  ORF type:complete len:1538 (+),score=424.15 TRINITY_DN1192_c0_g1_i3:82-4614(+)